MKVWRCLVRDSLFKMESWWWLAWVGGRLKVHSRKLKGWKPERNGFQRTDFFCRFQPFNFGFGTKYVPGLFKDVVKNIMIIISSRIDFQSIVWTKIKHELEWWLLFGNSNVNINANRQKTCIYIYTYHCFFSIYFSIFDPINLGSHLHINFLEIKELRTKVKTPASFSNLQIFTCDIGVNSNWKRGSKTPQT